MPTLNGGIRRSLFDTRTYKMLNTKIFSCLGGIWGPSGQARMTIRLQACVTLSKRKQAPDYQERSRTSLSSSTRNPWCSVRKIIFMACSRARRDLFFSYIKPHFDQLRSALQEVVCMNRSMTATAGNFLNLLHKIASQKLRRSDIGEQTTRTFPLTRSSRWPGAQSQGVQFQ